MKLIIEDDDGRKTVVPLVRDRISIGRGESNAIRLTDRNVSRRHAILRREGDRVLIEDLGSSNGVLVNGVRIQGNAEIRPGDLVEIGDYGLALLDEGKGDAPPPLPRGKRNRNAALAGLLVLLLHGAGAPPAPVAGDAGDARIHLEEAT